MSTWVKTHSSPHAASWTLNLPDEFWPVESTVLLVNGSALADGSYIGKDQRRLVEEKDFQDGGKYRSIVKIQSCFKDKWKGTKIWTMGTGWLIRPDLLITAGHVVYAWEDGVGPANQMKCYIGYNGRDSFSSPTVQDTFGRSVVIPREWFDSSFSTRRRDIAFVKLNRPFTGNLNLFQFVDTPNSTSALLGVVGYPGDQYLTDGDKKRERGAQMYELFEKTSYDLENDPSKMIEYQISTFEGQCGAPVLRKDGNNLVAIGCHTFGGAGYAANWGNAIGGQYGNDYKAFINLLDREANTGKISVDETKPAHNGFMNISAQEPINRNFGPERALAFTESSTSKASINLLDREANAENISVFETKPARYSDMINSAKEPMNRNFGPERALAFTESYASMSKPARNDRWDTFTGAGRDDIESSLEARREVWVPLPERRRDLDDNDDGPVLRPSPPPDF